MRILSKKTFRFQKPGSSIIATGGENLNKPERYEDIYFVTKPNEVEEAPEWIRKDKMFELATKDGDLLEIAGTGKQPTKDDIAVAAASSQAAEAARRIAPGTDPATELHGAVATTDLKNMTKAELVEHAAEVHDLELDPKLKHDELVAAIQEKQQESKS